MRLRYPQTCPVARAAEIVGERWTLLIVRELLLGPKRFSDLRQRLSSVSTSVLAQRLEALEERGVIERRELPPPVATPVYELTETGQALEPVIATLARWGLRFFLPTRADDHFEPDWMRRALGIFAKEGRSPALRFSVSVRVGEESYPFEVQGGRHGTKVSEGKSSAKNRIIIDAELLPLLMAGLADIDQAIGSGTLVMEGDENALASFPSLFEMNFGDADPRQVAAAIESATDSTSPPQRSQ